MTIGTRVTRLSALCTGHLYLPGNIPDTCFCYRLSQRQSHSVAGRIMSIKNSNDIWNQTRDLPACSTVPQPTWSLHMEWLYQSEFQQYLQSIHLKKHYKLHLKIQHITRPHHSPGNQLPTSHHGNPSMTAVQFLRDMWHTRCYQDKLFCKYGNSWCIWL